MTQEHVTIHIKFIETPRRNTQNIGKRFILNVTLVVCPWSASDSGGAKGEKRLAREEQRRKENRRDQALSEDFVRVMHRIRVVTIYASWVLSTCLLVLAPCGGGTPDENAS